MNNFPPITPSKREEILRQQYPFVHPPFEEVAWSIMCDAWGRPETWAKHHMESSRSFLEIVSGFMPETVSLAEIKGKIAGQHYSRGAGRLLFHFLVKVKDEYQADDSEMFHRVIDMLAQAGNTYYILWDKDVMSFDDIAYIKYYKHCHFYVIRTSNFFLKSLIRSVMMETQWSFEGKPNQIRIDNLSRVIDNVSKLRPINSLKDVDIPFFFELMDETSRQYRSIAFNYESRCLLIKDLIHVFRYCIGSGHMEPYGPVLDTEMFFRKSTVQFFIKEYVSLAHTFHYPHWQGNVIVDVLITLDIPNVFLRNTLGRFLGSGKECRAGFAMCRDNFVESLGEHAQKVGSPEYPFSEETFLTQVRFYSEKYRWDHHWSEAITFVKMFYLFIDEQSEGSFFRNANTLTYKLLTSRKFETYCENGYSFRRYSPYDRVIDGNRIVFFVSGLNHYRKNYLAEDYLTFDFSCVDNPFYRSIAWRALTSSIRVLYRKSFYYVLREILPFLIRLKSTPGYPVPQLDRITGWDTLFIAEYYHKKYPVALTYNHCMRELRSFLRWAYTANVLHVDIAAFMSLKGKKLKQLPSNTAVLPDSDAAEIAEYFASHAKSDSRFGQCLILMQLSLITPIRIGHLCSLRLDDLVYDERMKSYVVVSSSKATSGDKTEIILGGRADGLIRKAISINEKIAGACPDKDLRQHLFLYRNNSSFVVFNSKTFGLFMSKACNALGLPHYSSRNLRASYMTKAYIEASENGYANEFILKLFSYHKRVGTTLENYVNHSEALAALTEHLKRGNDWQKTVYPDEIAALKEVIEMYRTLINEADDESDKLRLQQELAGYEKQLESLCS